MPGEEFGGGLGQLAKECRQPFDVFFVFVVDRVTEFANFFSAFGGRDDPTDAIDR